MIHSFTDISKNVSMDCDVCVVGSGAGGAVVATELAEAGLKVVMIEEGGYFSTKDFKSEDTIWSTANLYRDGGATVIYGKPNVMFAEGRCVGGSTTINGAMCWRTPEKILKRWAWEFGLKNMTPETMDEVFAWVERRIKVGGILPEAKNRDSELLKLGAQRLGYACQDNIRSADHCTGANQCIGGCPTGAKQSTLVAYIPSFLAHQGELFTNCRAHQVIVEKGRAKGVAARFVDPVSKRAKHHLSVRARVVVVSGGAIQTPALIKKSGIRDQNRFLGKNLLVHPNMKVLACFDESVKAWHGVNQACQITEFFDEGILMGVNFGPPGVIALAMPLEGSGMLHTFKEEFHSLVLGGALIEDTGSGVVRVGPFDTVIPTYKLNDRDFGQCLRGAALLTEVFFAAGAKKCYLPFAGMHVVNSPDEIPKIFTLKLKPADLELFTVHIMGTARMGSHPANSVVNGFGEMHHVQGLFVADASVFPTSIGVNPQLTIMALATRTARHVAENFNRF